VRLLAALIESEDLPSAADPQIRGLHSWMGGNERQRLHVSGIAHIDDQHPENDRIVSGEIGNLAVAYAHGIHRHPDMSESGVDPGTAQIGVTDDLEILHSEHFGEDA